MVREGPLFLKMTDETDAVCVYCRYNEIDAARRLLDPAQAVRVTPSKVYKYRSSLLSDAILANSYQWLRLEADNHP